MATMLHRPDAPGDWGIMQAPDGGTARTGLLTEDRHPDIFYRMWNVHGPATLFFLHGLGAHSGWFIDMGNHFAQLGVNFVAMDHHGFGRSGGDKGHASDWRHYLRDIDRMVNLIAHDLPDTPIFLMGHSMGGVFAIHYAASHQQKLQGLILLNPWIENVTTRGPSLLQTLGIAIPGMFGSRAVGKLPDPKATGGMTTAPDMEAFFSSDSYWVYERTKGFYWQITLMRGLTLARAAQVQLPAYVCQGEADVTVVHDATRKAYERLASKDKTFRMYPGLEHDPEFQAERAMMDDDLVAWMQAHVVRTSKS